MLMTLREYIETGKTDATTLAYTLGVSEHAVHKWIYGQRSPHLATAIKIVEITKGKVKLQDLVKPAKEQAA